MTIRTEILPWKISSKLVSIIDEEMKHAGITVDVGAIVTFRDPDYSPESGGYHPVEIAIGPGGRMEYITDFAYHGIPPHCELAKELDFDFSLNLFQHFGIEFPLPQGLEMFRLWQSNFLAYHGMNVYSVSVESMG